LHAVQPEVMQGGGEEGLKVVVIDSFKVGEMEVEQGSPIRNAGYALTIAKLAAKQEYMQMRKAKLKTVVKRYGNKQEASPQVEAIMKQAATDAFLDLSIDSLTVVAQAMLPAESLAALGALDPNAVDDPVVLKQRLIDGLIDWAAGDSDFQEAFEAIDKPKPDRQRLLGAIRRPTKLSGGNICDRYISARASGPAISVLRDKASQPEFLSDLTAQGDPYRDYPPYQLLSKSVFMWPRLVILDEVSWSRISLPAEAVVRGDGNSNAPAEGAGGDEDASVTGGPELYPQLVAALAEYMETHMESSEASGWVPSSGAVAFARLAGKAGDGARVHAVRIQRAAGVEPGQQEGELMATLTSEDLLAMSDAVDAMLKQYPNIMALKAPPSFGNLVPSSRAPWWKVGTLGRVVAGGALVAAMALLAGRNLLGGGLPSARGEAYRPGESLTDTTTSSREGDAAPARPAARERSYTAQPINAELSELELGHLCALAREALRTQVLASGQVNQLPKDAVLEFQHVVSATGETLGLRPVNGPACNMYEPLELRNVRQAAYKDVPSRAAVLKSMISRREADSGIEAAVEVRPWTDADSLVLWGYAPDAVADDAGAPAEAEEDGGAREEETQPPATTEAALAASPE